MSLLRHRVAPSLALLFAVSIVASCGGESDDGSVDVDTDGATAEADASADVGDAGEVDVSPEADIGSNGVSSSCDSASPTCEVECGADEFCSERCECEPFTLERFDDADSEAWILAANSCADIALAMRVQDDGRVGMSALLPESVLLAAADVFGGERYQLANDYVWSVISAVFDSRFTQALAVLDLDAMASHEVDEVIRAVFFTDTLVPLEAISDATIAFCPELELAVEKKIGGEVPASHYGFVCPLPGIPSCNAPEPPAPHGCPSESLGCPDCPILLSAGEELAELLEVLEAFPELHSRQSAMAIRSQYVTTLADTLVSGEMPHPDDLAPYLATALLGAEHSSLSFVSGVLASSGTGGLDGSPLIGGAVVLWTALAFWGGLNPQTDWRERQSAARQRFRAATDYCREIEWSTRRIECAERESMRLERRELECAESSVANSRRATQWEARNAACEAEREFAVRQRSIALGVTSYLRAVGYGYSSNAFSECCDHAFPFDFQCPRWSDGSDRNPIPAWAYNPADTLIADSLPHGRRRVPAWGPDAAGSLALNVFFGNPDVPSVEFPELAERVRVVGARFVGPAGFDVRFVDPLPEYLHGFETELAVEHDLSEPNPFGDRAVVNFDLVLDLEIDERTFTSTVSEVYTIFDNSDDR